MNVMQPATYLLNGKVKGHHQSFGEANLQLLTEEVQTPSLITRPLCSGCAAYVPLCPPLVFPSI